MHIAVVMYVCMYVCMSCMYVMYKICIVGRFAHTLYIPWYIQKEVNTKTLNGDCFPTKHHLRTTVTQHYNNNTLLQPHTFMFLLSQWLC